MFSYGVDLNVRELITACIDSTTGMPECYTRRMKCLTETGYKKGETFVVCILQSFFFLRVINRNQ